MVQNIAGEIGYPEPAQTKIEEGDTLAFKLQEIKIEEIGPVDGVGVAALERETQLFAERGIEPQRKLVFLVEVGRDGA